MRAPLSTCVLAITVPAVAQTFIVDVNSGPGTSFTSIAAAVAAAPEGAVLVVRQGSYDKFVISNKSLKVLADPGVSVFAANLQQPTITVVSLQAGKSVVLRGLDVRPPYPGHSPQVTVNGCAGSVLLDRIQIEYGRLQATSCNQLLVRDAAPGNGPLTGQLTNCTTVLERCTFFPGLVGTAVTVTGGTLQIIDSTVTSGVVYPPYALVANAVEMQGGDLRLLGNTTLSSIAVSTSFTVGGSGTVRYDNSVVVAAPMFAPTITATALEMPTMTTSFAGGQATASVTGAPGNLVAAAVGLPGPLLQLPGLDAIWLDLATFTPLGLGVLGTSPFSAHLSWASGPVPGVRAVFQALTFDPTTGFAISNPSLLILP